MVLCSVSEGFPYSLIEAMTCGRACVGTDVGGVTEALGDTGLVVPPRSPERLARACLTLLRDDRMRRRLGSAARARALEYFTVDEAINTFDEIYHFLGSGQPMPAAPAAPAAPAVPATVSAAAAVRLGAAGGAPKRRRCPWRPCHWAPPRERGHRGGPAAASREPVGVSPRRHGRAAGGGPRDVDELCAQFTPVCESAVDPLEICCALEFEGWNDKAVRDCYGVPDVFALAEQMYLRVPRRPAEPDQAPDPWQLATARPAMHGLLYGLPTVCFPAAAGLLTGPGVVALLVVVSLVSWAISQSLAYLGYLRLGQADPALAGRLLRAGLAAGLAGVLLALAVTAVVLPAGVAAPVSRPGWAGTCSVPRC